MDTGRNDTDLMQLASEVLLNYNIVPEGMSIIQNVGLKTVWKFSCNGRGLCLKRLKHPREKALFSVNAQKYIYDRDGNVPEVLLNLKDDVITEFRGQIFVLYSWIDGRDLDFRNPTDLRFGIEGLSQFHKFSRGYRPPENARVSSKIGKWHKQYESMKNRMAEWKREAEIKPNNPSCRAYIKYVDTIIEIADAAINALKASPYDTLTSIRLEQSILCHQDYGEGNALLAGQNVLVLDLDGVTYDLSVRDLRKIIGKRMENFGEWNSDKIKSILEWYEKYNELSLGEKNLLKIDLLFPHWFFGDVKNLFQKAKSVRESEIEKIAKLEQSKVKILDKLF